MISLYCERLGPGILAEPVNAFTNAAFFIAAWEAWSLARRSKRVAAGVWLLVALTVAIGIGSALFHTLATGWARILDEVPILLFQLCYTWLYARSIMTWRAAAAAAVIAGYLIAVYFSRQFPHLLNGSLVYAPALVLLPALGVCHALYQKRERWLLLGATGVFIVSVAFRSLDRVACSALPIGTHFMWHLLNGVVLYLSMRALILNRPAQSV